MELDDAGYGKLRDAQGASSDTEGIYEYPLSA